MNQLLVAALLSASPVEENLVCTVTSKASLARRYSQDELARLKFSVRLVGSAQTVRVERCSFAPSAGRVTCDSYTVDRIDKDPIVGHRKYYVFRPQYDLQIFADMSFLENNGRGDVSLGTCCTNPLDTKCKALGEKQFEEMQLRDPAPAAVTTGSFYSSKLAAIVQTEVADVGVNFVARDISHSVMKDDGSLNVLFHCDESGADVTRIDKVREHRGLVFNVPYTEWLDDGEGGPPRTVKTPAVPYTKARCAALFEKWRNQLR